MAIGATIADRSWISYLSIDMKGGMAWIIEIKVAIGTSSGNKQTDGM